MFKRAVLQYETFSLSCTYTEQLEGIHKLLALHFASKDVWMMLFDTAQKIILKQIL